MSSLGVPRRPVVFGGIGPCLLGTPIAWDIPVPCQTELHMVYLLEGRLGALCLLLPPTKKDLEYGRCWECEESWGPSVSPRAELLKTRAWNGFLDGESNACYYIYHVPGNQPCAHLQVIWMKQLAFSLSRPVRVFSELWGISLFLHIQ